MRTVLVIAAGLLTVSCASMLRETSTKPSPNYASLSYRVADSSPLHEWDGIQYVDGHEFRQAQAHVYVARGNRVIGYNCPDSVTVDAYAGLQHQFEGGKRYEIVCEKAGPAIYALPD